MSILDDGPLVTSGRPKTYGDQLPGRFPSYKDGVEEEWSRKEAKAIRCLASGFTPKRAAVECKITLRKLTGWMGNPYFMMEIGRLTDHHLFQWRSKVLETVALRAIAGSPQHAKIYLQLTRDLVDEAAAARKSDDPFSKLNPEELDKALVREFDLAQEE